MNKKQLAIGAVGTAFVGWLALIPDGITHPIRAIRGIRRRGQTDQLVEHLNANAFNDSELTQLSKNGWRSNPPFHNRSITQILPS